MECLVPLAAPWDATRFIRDLKKSFVKIRAIRGRKPLIAIAYLNDARESNSSARRPKSR
jgi:hypothetical protein